MKNVVLTTESISPCGMNCGICIAYLRDKKPCSGCRIESKNKPKHCINCRIINCEYLAKVRSGFYFDWERFPCAKMKQSDLRYRENYHASLIENLKRIQRNGVENFIKQKTINGLALAWFPPLFSVWTGAEHPSINPLYFRYITVSNNSYPLRINLRLYFSKM